MKCIECEKPTELDHTGICEECKIKLKTCTVCGKVLETFGSAYVKVENDNIVARGHRECVETHR